MREQPALWRKLNSTRLANWFEGRFEIKSRPIVAVLRATKEGHAFIRIQRPESKSGRQFYADSDGKRVAHAETNFAESELTKKELAKLLRLHQAIRKQTRRELEKTSEGSVNERLLGEVLTHLEAILPKKKKKPK